MKPLLTLIIGVHRSGTSLITHGLAAMGAAQGQFDESRDADNPDGYAEHPGVRQFNDQLLGHLGASWDNWGFRASSVDFGAPEFAPWRDDAVRLLQQVFDGAGPFVLKDPRIATLAPFWERVVPAAGFELRRVVILRDPAEVAESQIQRAERRPQLFPVIAAPEPMAALWAVTMHEVLAALRDDATMLVSHAQLMADPVRVLAAVAPFAGLSPSEDMLTEFARTGVKPALHRASVTQAPAGPWMDAARAFFAALDPVSGPRALPRTAADAVLHQQTGLVPLMAGLSAARDSIARMHESQTLRMQAVTDISRYVWLLAPLATFAPRARLSKTIERAEALAQETPLERTSLAFGHSMARLYISAGRLDDAAAWLDRLRPHFGHVPAFGGLEQALADARQAQSSGKAPGSLGSL